MKNPFAPPMHWLVSLAEFYFRRKILRQPLPLLASFKLTYQCNLACRACPFHRRAQNTTSCMSWNQAVALLGELHKTGCRIVVFEGGEPLLWEDGDRDLRNLIWYAKTLFLRVCVTTNGTFPLNIPADVIWVSIDGLRETHNLLRSNSFDTIWRNLLTASHSNILLHYTINRINWRDVGLLIKRIKDFPSVRGMTVQFFYPYGQGEEDLCLKDLERKEVIENILKLKRSGYPVLNSTKSLIAMRDGFWYCREDVLINIDPDGTVTRGCYVKNRGRVDCRMCGFTPVAEASAALQFVPESILAGWRIFFGP